MFLTGFAVAAALAVSSLPAASAPFAGELWQNRIVLIFAPPLDDRAAEQSRLLLSAPDDLRRRDLLVVRVDGHEISVLFGTASGPLEAGELRAGYRVAPDESFAVVLVGKDGGEKLRRTTIVKPRELFAIIDAMPMRRNEAKKP